MIKARNKFIFVLLILVLSGEIKAQTGYILYDLPEKVTEKAKGYIATYIARNGSTNFIAELSKNGDGNYVLFIIIDDFEKQQPLSILYEQIIKKTNRMVRLDDHHLLPLITSEDLQFAFLGDSPPRKPGGPKGKKKVVFTHESYSITFDTTGKIYE